MFFTKCFTILQIMQWRYTNPGGHIHIYVGKRGGKPFYRVEDDGIGIPKSEQKRIFERFYRVDKSHSRQTGGTGLGLSIVKHGANLHHAKITVDSDLGKGTKMELHILGSSILYEIEIYSSLIASSSATIMAFGWN